VDSSDQLTTLFRHANTLFTEGTVVWGQVIQANELMFEGGNDNCPGEVVYSLKDPQRADPEYLEHVALELYSLKGTEPNNPELAQIAEYLTDETIRVYGLPVPSVVSPLYQCQISTTFFVRKHLPGRRLLASLLPIIVNPRKPHVALPLPERYWPPELLDWWFDQGSTSGGEQISVEGQVETWQGKLALRIPLEAGGAGLVEYAGTIGRVADGHLVVVIEQWLAENLGISEDSLVRVDNGNGKFRITPIVDDDSADAEDSRP
jgi:hypothetical protein